MSMNWSNLSQQFSILPNEPSLYPTTTYQYLGTFLRAHSTLVGTIQHHSLLLLHRLSRRRVRICCWWALSNTQRYLINVVPRPVLGRNVVANGTVHGDTLSQVQAAADTDYVVMQIPLLLTFTNAMMPFREIAQPGSCVRETIGNDRLQHGGRFIRKSENCFHIAYCRLPPILTVYWLWPGSVHIVIPRLSSQSACP